MPAINAPAQIAPGTGAAQQPAVSFASVAAQAATATGAAGIPSTSITSSAFPAKSLGIRVDLNLGGTWTDITAYVLQRNPLQITGMGRADWTSTIQAAQLTLTLRNDSGRFSPKNSAGAYFPNITRNTPIRVFVSATSSTNQSYSGFRFYGEVSEWPIRWDPSGRDVSADIVASGIWRRVSQQQTTLGSAFRRYVDSLAGPAVQAYWPCEDGSGSGQLVPFGSPAGTANALQQFVGGTAGLSLAAASAFPGSDALPQFNGAMIIANVPAGGTPTNNVIRLGLSVPAAGDSGGSNWNIAEVHTAGTVKTLELYLLAGGFLKMQGVSAAGSVQFAATTTTNVLGQPYLVSMELTPSGGNVAFALRIIKAGASGITESVTGTLTTASVGAAGQIRLNRSFSLQDTACGQLYVHYASPVSMVAAANALGGYTGEKALDRFTRICAEQGIVTETIGVASQSAAMGPQDDDTIANVLQSIEDTDCGLLYESKSQFALGYRTNGSMANQSVQLTLSYTAAVVDASLATAYDDQLTRNNITITNYTGYSQQAILTAGAMSILNPPSGIGNGYSYTRNVNAASDSQCPGIATFLLNIGASDEVRFPVISVKMVRASLAPFFASVPNLDIGDYFQVTNPPSFLTNTAIKQLMWGYSETLNAREWTFALNSVPETPWETGVSPGTVQTAQIPGGSPVSSQAQGSLGLASLIANGSITPSMLAEGITVRTLGGTAITVAAIAPSGPGANDIWINSTTGLISQWNGSSWAPVKFDGSVTILPGTVVAANIATGTLTASLIAAGQVYAGFVDATIIQAAEILSISTDALPDYLAYQGSVGAGNLITSIAPVAGTDTVSNPYPAGIYGQQLTLKSQGSAPAAFTGSSELYTSTSGRLRYVSESGADMVLDRSSLDLTNKTMTTQTAATIMSAGLSYLANEAQVGSEFEVEIDGTITTPTTVNTSMPVYNSSLFLDGATMGANNVTWGTTMLGDHLTIAYHIRWNITINTTGAGGTCDVIASGGSVIQFNTGAQFNLGNFSPTRTPPGGGGGQGSTPINQITTSVAFDTTANHTIAIYNNWSATLSSGHSAITYRTKLTRRN